MVKQLNVISKIVCIRDKFNITIPQKIRELIDINIGDHIQFSWDGNSGIKINKVKTQIIEINKNGEGGDKNTTCNTKPLHKNKEKKQ